MNLQTNWEKLCPNLSFTVGNKISQGWPHLILNIMQEIFNFLKFQEFINELRKIRFSLRKMKFWAHWKFCTYYRIFEIRKDAANTLTSICWQGKYRLKKVTVSTEKVFQLKKVQSLMVLKFQNLKFNFLFFLIMSNFSSSEVNKAILEQVKVVELD